MTLFSLEAMIKKLSTQAATSERTVLELQKELATVRDERDAVESENKDCKRAIKELSAQARLENVALADKEKVTYERMRELKERYDVMQRELELRTEELAQAKVRVCSVTSSDSHGRFLSAGREGWVGECGAHSPWWLVQQL